MITINIRHSIVEITSFGAFLPFYFFTVDCFFFLKKNLLIYFMCLIRLKFLNKKNLMQKDTLSYNHIVKKFKTDKLDADEQNLFTTLDHSCLSSFPSTSLQQSKYHFFKSNSFLLYYLTRMKNLMIRFSFC